MTIPSDVLFRLDLEMEGLPLNVLKEGLVGNKTEKAVEFVTNTLIFVRQIETKKIIIQDDLMEFEDCTCSEADFYAFMEQRYSGGAYLQ